MATSFEVIFLGNLPHIDPTQNNEVAENAAGILGTHGSASDPLSGHVQNLVAERLTEDDNSSYDTDNGGGYDSFHINGGVAQNFDAVATYNATITYADGTTATITATVFQDVNGNTYLAPEETANADQTALTAKPIQSLQLTSVVANTGDMLAARVAGDFLGPVDGTTGNDTMGVGYTDAQNDHITEGSDHIQAGAGHDTVSAGGGGDAVYGGDGNDSLTGGTGADRLDGGAGTDTASYATSVTGVTVNLGTGQGQGGDAAGDTLTGIENLTGSAQADRLTGDTAANLLTGGAGNDTLSGGDGHDTLTGDADHDSLSGGAGNDALYGGTGNDTLMGGAGNDSLTGGAGFDVYQFDPASGQDTILDFDLTDANADGLTNDQLDVSDLLNAQGRPVRVFDITVTDDGLGNAVLTFPGGESIRFQGISPAQMQAPGQMHAAGIPCFTPGTHIETAHGPLPVERLRPGHLVRTLDHGLQPVRWVGCRHLGPDDLAANPHLRPIVIRKGVLGNHRALRVSPQHGFLLHGRLVRAKHLAQAWGSQQAHVLARVPSVTYVHFLCDRHQIVYAEGALTESLYPGPQALAAMGAAALAEVLAIFPDLAQVLAPASQSPIFYGPPARPYEKGGDLRRTKGLNLVNEKRQVVDIE